MTLPGSARGIKVNGRSYRWMVGKVRIGEENLIYANIVIESDDGKVSSFEEVIGFKKSSQAYSVSPALVRDLIIDKKL